jgi:hypothetical protein
MLCELMRVCSWSGGFAAAILPTCVTQLQEKYDHSKSEDCICTTVDAQEMCALAFFPDHLAMGCMAEVSNNILTTPFTISH